LLVRAAVALEQDYRRAIGRKASLHIETFSADPDDLPVPGVPLLVRAAVASEQDYRRAIGGAAALHVEAFSADPDELPVAEVPLLVGAALTGEQDYRRTIGSAAALHVETFAAGPDHLSGAAGNAETKQSDDEEPKGQAEGIEVRGPVDHGFVRSIYFRDPNGYVIELTASTGVHGEIMDPAVSKPHDQLARWQAAKSA